MNENFTITSLINKDYYRNELIGLNAAKDFYIYENGRWLCMLRRLDNASYKVISYSTAISSSIISAIGNLIEEKIH
ncbi:MAG: hypothetical protein JKY70_01770 [Mucilaginibacter sp.]|nr:hypothetical protein [Mucilaginibacter sp.]